MRSELFLDAVKNTLAGTVASWDRLSIDDWLELMEIAGEQNMISAIYPVIRTCPAAGRIGESFFGPFEKRYLRKAEDDRTAEKEFRQVYGLLEREGIRPVIVDGPAISSLYRMCASDETKTSKIYVSPDRLESAYDCLTSHGYTVNQMKNAKNSYSIRDREGKRVLMIDAVDYDARKTQVICGEGGALRIAEPTAYLASILSQAKEDILAGNMDLWKLCNIVMASSWDGWKIDGKSLMRICEEEKLLSMTQAIFRIGERTMGIRPAGALSQIVRGSEELDENPMLENILSRDGREDLDLSAMDMGAAQAKPGVVQVISQQMNSLVRSIREEDNSWEERRSWIQGQIDAFTKVQRTKTAELYGLI